MRKKKQRSIDRRKLHKDCWNLDYAFIKWLNQHLIVFKKDASKIVDLEYYKFEYHGQELTQLQIIDKLIRLTTEILVSSDMWEQSCCDKVNEVLELWKLVFPTMWW